MKNYDHFVELDPNISYLNHAAVSPWPKRTAEVVSQFAMENMTQGASAYPLWLEKEQDLRDRLATLIGLSHSADIGLAKSTSEALSIIAYGIDWKPGDEILIADQEFPSNRIVWESLSNLGVTVKTFKLGQNIIESISPSISNKTRLISMSSVQYASGRKVDLESLSAFCRTNDILLCVDAIQSLGALSFNQNTIDADFIVADGHKWMMGPEGLALLYVAPTHQSTLKLYQYGWHMVDNAGDYDTKSWQVAHSMRRFECGSPNMLGIHALESSLSVLEEVGYQEIEEQLQERVDYILGALGDIKSIQILSPTNKTDRGGIVNFKIDQFDSKEVYQHLMSKGVICANRGGGIRFSPHFYTPADTIDKAIAKLRRLIEA